MCASCTKPVGDQARLCRRCTEHLEQQLGDVPALAIEVQTTRARLSRTGGAPIGGGHGSDRPLPWDDRPVRAAAAARGVLARWVMLVVEQRGVRMPVGTLTGMSGFLLGQVDWLRHREEAADAKGELEQAVRRLRASVDRAPDRWFAGVCSALRPVDLADCDCACHVGGAFRPACDVPGGCGTVHEDATVPAGVPCEEDLYVVQGASTVRCRTCGTEHDVEYRRKVLREHVEDQLATVAELTTAVSNLARPVSKDTIKSWVRRDRLVERGRRPSPHDDDGVALYRVGDVLELLAEDARRRAG